MEVLNSVTDSEVIQIQQATLDDLDDLAGLFDAYRVFYEKPSDPHGARAFIGERLRLRESVIFIARDRRTDAAAGFTQLYPLFTSTNMRRCWLLNDLYVLAQFRQMGIAAALMARARRHAEQTGAAYLMLETDESNRTAQRLYEKEGWQRYTGTRFYTLSIDQQP